MNQLKLIWNTKHFSRVKRAIWKCQYQHRGIGIGINFLLSWVTLFKISTSWKKCRYSKFLWSVFSRIWTVSSRISSYSVWMREKCGPKNSLRTLFTQYFFENRNFKGKYHRVVDFNKNRALRMRSYSNCSRDSSSKYQNIRFIHNSIFTSL